MEYLKQFNISELRDIHECIEKEAEDKEVTKRDSARYKEAGVWLEKNIKSQGVEVQQHLSKIVGNIKIPDFCARKLRQAIVDELGMGWYLLLQHRARAEMLKGSITEEQNLRYSSLVPLILAAQKEHQGIKYETWSYPNDLNIKSSGLGALMNYRPKANKHVEYYEGRYGMSKHDMLSIRDKCLQLRLKKIYSPLQTHTPKDGDNAVFKEFDTLTRVIAQQFWIADPSLRNEYMILDPLDWDNMPEPLV